MALFARLNIYKSSVPITLITEFFLFHQLDRSFGNLRLVFGNKLICQYTHWYSINTLAREIVSRVQRIMKWTNSSISFTCSRWALKNDVFPTQKFFCHAQL